MERYSVLTRGDYSPSRPEANLPKRPAANRFHGPDEIKPSQGQRCRVPSSDNDLGEAKGILSDSNPDT
jgi:hypothetical protein